MTALNRYVNTLSLLPAAARALHRAGVLGFPDPLSTGRWLRETRRHGPNLATLVFRHAFRAPNAAALIDEQGPMTRQELARNSRHLAGYLADRHGVAPGRTMGILCRNHRGFVEAMLAGCLLGADLVFLNTDFPGPQLAQVLERHEFAVILHDGEFTATLQQAGYEGPALATGPDARIFGNRVTVDEAIRLRLPPPSRRVKTGRIILLTSGTTGTPKGAPRTPDPLALIGPAATLLGKTPLRTGKPLLVSPPLFHGFGLAFGVTGLVLGMPLVLQRRFDPEPTLAALATHRVRVAVMVPVMLQRILELPADTLDRANLCALDGLLSAAAPLPAALAWRWMDRFGDRLYNLYGSSEAGFGTLATPVDLRLAPGTIGRPPQGTCLKILDGEGQECPVGQIGHVCIRSDMLFEGYVGGGNKTRWNGYLNTGDIGRVDHAGRVFIDGREDDMIVSGGENVYPQEVADTLLLHERIADAAVFGVPDEEFGQRLKAFVVTRETVSEAQLKTYLKDRIARYKMPREIIFLEELPRNPGGKVMKGALLAM